MYTLFGHEGPSTAATWSPYGDYFLTGGQDSVVLCWSSNMNPIKQEDLCEISSKIQTEVFVTQKEKMDKLPSTRGTKMGKSMAKKKKTQSPTKSFDKSLTEDNNETTIDDPNLPPAAKVVKGITFRKLRPEVKATLEKVVYQLELIGKTLLLLEQRIVDSEDKLQDVMQFIKESDLEYQPQIINQVLSMNRFDENTGELLKGESPVKQFGTPLPGDPSIHNTIQQN